ncbi:MAG TPA: iron-sulfur cluster biosynthesis protein [Mycobacteriales bacterium]|jgi:Fe-S cluster assembly iron-binding protein IscA|nr:iron-sulfur cluster biosynthesis protein [Mycobacteriales bacterium]HVU60758.1 iron-sulfur cluster biosynthesis protein [Mycobacteriales bacterium]
MLTLTQDARLAIVGLVQPISQDGHAGVRIAVADTANGQGPELGLALTDGPEPGDRVIDEEGARVFLDQPAAALLDQATLDVRIDEAAQEVDFFLT